MKERVKSVLNYKKPAFWLLAAAVLACVAVAVCFLTDPKEEKQLSVDSVSTDLSGQMDQKAQDKEVAEDAREKHAKISYMLDEQDGCAGGHAGGKAMIPYKLPQLFRF